MGQCDCRQRHVTLCGMNSVYHHVHVLLFTNRLPETALLWWVKGSALRQSSTDKGPVQKHFLSRSKIHFQNSGELGSNCPRHCLFPDGGLLEPPKGSPCRHTPEGTGVTEHHPSSVELFAGGHRRGKVSTGPWESCSPKAEFGKYRESRATVKSSSFHSSLRQPPLCNVRQGNSHSPYLRKVSSVLTQLP